MQDFENISGGPAKCDIYQRTGASSWMLTQSDVTIPTGNYYSENGAVRYYIKSVGGYSASRNTKTVLAQSSS